MKETPKKIIKKKVAVKKVKSKTQKKTTQKKIIQKKPKKFEYKSPLFIFSAIALVLISALVGFYIFVKSNQDFAANFADNILRPLIGNQSTISIEAFFFTIEDHLNRVEYNSFHHSLTTKPVYAQNNDTIEDIMKQEIDPTFPLRPLTPLINDNTLSGEGKWFPIVSSKEGKLIARTLVRPDKERPYALVSLVLLNSNFLHLGSMAGTEQPGGPEKPGVGKIPDDIRKSNSLIAGFNGGFQKKDGYYGMIVGDVTYLPLQKNLATLVIHKNGAPVLLRYTGQNLGNDVEAVRQNGPMLIENGKIVTSSSGWNMETWGLTTTNSMYTSRSGLGVTKEGNVIFASGPSLVPETLAKALFAAGAVNAMQLDINSYWVRFALFTSLGNGEYSTRALEKDMEDGGPQYLNGYNKDFFYVYKK